MCGQLVTSQKIALLSEEKQVTYFVVIENTGRGDLISNI